MANNDGKQQFEQQVSPAELSEINSRRTRLGLEQVDTHAKPSAHKGLVGLCLSGGGIRSATFSLGVIQALSKHDVLKKIDYLSTVSGGGYTGSCISSVLNNPNTGSERNKFPFRGALGEDEPEPISHLRNSSNYLAPISILDKLRIPALVLRGIISNFLLFLFWVIIAVVMTELAYEVLSHYWDIAFSTITAIVFGVFLLMILGYPVFFCLLRRKLDWKNRDRIEFWFTVVWLLSLLTVVSVPVVILINQAINISFHEFRDRIETSIIRPVETSDIWIWLGVLSILFLFTRVSAASERLSSITGKVVLYTAGIIGPGVLVIVYLLLVVWQVDVPTIDSKFRSQLDNGEISDELKVQLEYKDVRLPNKTVVIPTAPLPGWKLAGKYLYDINCEPLPCEQHKKLKVTRRIHSASLLKVLQASIGERPSSALVDRLQAFGVKLSKNAEITGSPAPSPRDIVLLVDNSVPSGKTKEEIKNALQTSVGKVLSLPMYSDIQVSIVIFDEKVRIASKFFGIGQERSNIIDPLSEAEFSGLATNKASALLVAMSKLDEPSRSESEKVIIMISDGVTDSDNPRADKETSAWIKQQFVALAKSKDIKIYGLVTSETADYGLIQSLAQGTGGEIFPAFDAEKMALAFERIRDQLEHSVITAQWTIRDSGNKYALTRRNNEIIFESFLSITDGAASNLATVEDPVMLANLQDISKSLAASGLGLNHDNVTIERDLANPKTPTWHIKDPFSVVVIDKDSVLAIQSKQPWTQLWDGKLDWGFLAVFAALLLYRLLIDVNATSIHSFYRDRLSRSFIFGLNDSGHIEFNDDLKLHELNKAGTTAPYHLINVALNLHGSKDPYLRGRNADFFIFSKHFTGSRRTGFTKTKRFEELDRHLNLATAMAISGAAAAPNMGTTTVKQLVFLLTMLNIRLGYWLPNPRIVNERSAWKNLILRFGVGARYLLRESLSQLDDKGSFINISDGGHLENLGMYELLRRRCKFIISIDGEADPNMSFGGLVKLILYARIDMGIVIDIDLNPIRKNTDGISEKNYALGTIHYGNNEIGHLLYIKSSLAGDEPEYIREYKSRKPSFPHESTVDQFFDETQFEAYRALGFHIGNKLLVDDKELGKFIDLKPTATMLATTQ